MVSASKYSGRDPRELAIGGKFRGGPSLREELSAEGGILQIGLHVVFHQFHSPRIFENLTNR